MKWKYFLTLNPKVSQDASWLWTLVVAWQCSSAQGVFQKWLDAVGEPARRGGKLSDKAPKLASHFNKIVKVILAPQQ